MTIDLEKEQFASHLKGSLIEFTKVFYPLLTGRPYMIGSPLSREPHHITISKALTRAFRLEIPSQKLIINVSPGSGKSTMVSMWIAWALAQHPDSKFLYVSYSKSLASKHTETIKRIMSLSHYRYLFDVNIRHDSKAREFFQTNHGGAVAAVGSGGTVTGLDAGVPGIDRFGGALVIDDPIKPDEASSETIRKSVIENYRETLQQRLRSTLVPTIFIGQRVHEDDLAAYLIEGKDGYSWETVILKSLDDSGNAMYPEVNSKESLLIKQERDPYVFASQYQQNPIPAGGALFKPEWFVILDEEPNMVLTFITADTAETSKSYNDATVFSFWGLYEIDTLGVKTGEYALHWIDCIELRVEPKDLKDEFMSFWQACARHAKPPMMAAIEKKSTGVTLISVLQEIRGMQIRDIQRTAASGSKTQRFLEIQPYIASKLVSLPNFGKHTKMCLDHMSKITANDSHRWDDISDTASDAIKIALIEKSFHSHIRDNGQTAATIMQNQKNMLNLRRNLYGSQQNGTR